MYVLPPTIQNNFWFWLASGSLRIIICKHQYKSQPNMCCDIISNTLTSRKHINQHSDVKRRENMTSHPPNELRQRMTTFDEFLKTLITTSSFANLSWTEIEFGQLITLHLPQTELHMRRFNSPFDLWLVEYIQSSRNANEV